jgi:hypothetical protein
MTDYPVTQAIGHPVVEQITLGLLHVEGIQPLYRRQSRSRTLQLVEATVYVDASTWPPAPEQAAATITYAMQVTGLPRDKITVAVLPGDDSRTRNEAIDHLMANEPFKPVPRLRRPGEDDDR